jgi:hypothetical protein
MTNVPDPYHFGSPGSDPISSGFGKNLNETVQRKLRWLQSPIDMYCFIGNFIKNLKDPIL